MIALRVTADNRLIAAEMGGAHRAEGDGGVPSADAIMEIREALEEAAEMASRGLRSVVVIEVAPA